MSLCILVVGAAAGGGLPQWNCNAPNSARFWRHGADIPVPASQSSIAASIDGRDWVLFNASPDMRAQIMAQPFLQPREPEKFGQRDSPIRAVVLTNGDVDHIAGLLTLREKQAFTLWMTADIGEIIAANPVFDVLDPEYVTRMTLELETDTEILPGLSIRLFSVPGKTPLYMEGETVVTDQIGGQTVGVELSDGRSRACYIPGCAAMPPELAARLRGCDLALFDGTLFTDDEMIQLGVGSKTGKRMGHMSMSGSEGSMAAFADLEVSRKIYVHINNTNPVWRPDSEERAAVVEAGWEIAHDGMELRL